MRAMRASSGGESSPAASTTAGTPGTAADAIILVARAGHTFLPCDGSQTVTGCNLFLTFRTFGKALCTQLYQQQFWRTARVRRQRKDVAYSPLGVFSAADCTALVNPAGDCIGKTRHTQSSLRSVCTHRLSPMGVTQVAAHTSAVWWCQSTPAQCIARRPLGCQLLVLIARMRFEGCCCVLAFGLRVAKCGLSNHLAVCLLE
jgi:hypothetical protein